MFNMIYCGADSRVFSAWDLRFGRLKALWVRTPQWDTIFMVKKIGIVFLLFTTMDTCRKGFSSLLRLVA